MLCHLFQWTLKSAFEIQNNGSQTVEGIEVQMSKLPNIENSVHCPTEFSFPVNKHSDSAFTFQAILCFHFSFDYKILSLTYTALVYINEITIQH